MLKKILSWCELKFAAVNSRNGETMWFQHQYLAMHCRGDHVQDSISSHTYLIPHVVIWLQDRHLCTVIGKHLALLWLVFSNSILNPQNEMRSFWIDGYCTYFVQYLTVSWYRRIIFKEEVIQNLKSYHTICSETLLVSLQYFWCGSNQRAPVM